MIKDERLKELIEQRATIYEIKKDFYIVDPSEIVKVEKINSHLWKKFLDSHLECNEYHGGTDLLYEELFETKEEAEFALRYKRIPKTEFLDLPTYEEAKNGIEYQFYAPKGNIYLLSTKIKVGYSVDKENPYIIRVERIGYSNSEHDFEFTKENYIEACELCKKFFLGEEV